MKKGYKITYNGNGAAAGILPVDTKLYASGAQAIAKINPPDLVKSGYTFLKWNTQSNGSGTSYFPGDAITVGSADIPLFAIWDNSTYSVTYDGNGNDSGTLVPTDNQSYAPGSTVKVKYNNSTPPLSRAGYVFSGWTKSGGSGTTYQPDQTFIITQNTTLSAIWTTAYRVIYDSNEGSGTVTDSAYYLPGQTITLKKPGTLTKNSCEFAGWTTEKDGTTIYDADSQYPMGNSNQTFYARWKCWTNVTGTSPIASYSQLSMVMDGTTAYLVSLTGYYINVYKISGKNYTQIGTNIGQTSSKPIIAVDNNTVYVAYIDMQDSNKPKIIYFDTSTSSWQTINPSSENNVTNLNFFIDKNTTTYYLSYYSTALKLFKSPLNTTSWSLATSLGTFGYGCVD